MPVFGTMDVLDINRRNYRVCADKFLPLNLHLWSCFDVTLDE